MIDVVVGNGLLKLLLFVGLIGALCAAYILWEDSCE